jgi:hypothetical protein
MGLRILGLRPLEISLALSSESEHGCWGEGIKENDGGVNSTMIYF